MARRRTSRDALLTLQARSVGHALLRCGELMALEVPDVNRDASTRLLLFLQGAGEVRMTELAQRLGITKQGAQQQVAALVKRRLVTVSADAQDARVRRVALADDGVAALAAQAEALLAWERAAGGRVGRTALRQLHDALKRVLPALEEGRPS